MDGSLPSKGATPLSAPKSRWRPEDCGAMSEPDLLVYRSRLLGSDLAVTNFGGGNTSAKIASDDPLTGEPTTVLWVKGSGGDLGSIETSGFATLDIARLQQLDTRYRGVDQEDAMTGYLAHCTFNLNPRAASIDTALHALLPYAHVDHMHPDAITALATSRDGKALTREVFGDAIGWLAWRRPGWELARELAALAHARPKMLGVVLQNHGLVTWGDTSRDCYESTIETIGRAAGFVNAHLGNGAAFGGALVAVMEQAARRVAAVSTMARLRPLLSEASPKVGHLVDSPEALEFVCSAGLERLANIGTSCPDHFLRTKVRPLVIGPDTDVDGMTAAIRRYRDDYAAYYARCRRPDSPAMRDPYPVLVAVPGVGLISFAKDKATARIAGEFFGNAINVMRGAEAVSRYCGLPEQEAFDIEYWLLEEAKLKRMPAPLPLQGRIALITGGAGGIGRAIAARLLEDGACVFLADRSQSSLEEALAELKARGDGDRMAGLTMDVTSESLVEEAFQACVLEFGGLDILVANAGLASSAPIEEATLDQWRATFAVLGDGYFLAAREAFKIMKGQGGGSIVFVVSKNALAATPGASAYASAKAAELHLARCLALEGAPHGIRVNAVNPDAVIKGSQIWNGSWRAERATAYGIEDTDLEEFYRKRSLLQRSVLPEDVAEAVAFFAGERSAKSTGNILNVDGGNTIAFVR
ncbi:MAG: bifunctional rhamnulose-1-phosphate aldolase/short-chain dehydrogenase [Hyphomonadaceae bacterium]|nr:MAG: short chain dehydrogenase [Caulobacteraceae bacterium]MBT9444128.1 bifunctional rhamnulose-1-phosphate aldolase/short-chain dehydrogenase [Hyphomonadaceae bacterium]TPW07751.1 MAG: short chain dehydrogenase [Alphaproteobacteria bacterium]